MNALFEPLTPDVASAEEEASHTAWLQAKLARSIADPRPRIPHDEVMRRVEARIAYWQDKAQAAA